MASMKREISKKLRLAIVNEALAKGLIPRDHSAPMNDETKEFSFGLLGHEVTARIHSHFNGADLSIRAYVNKSKVALTKADLGADATITLWFEREKGPHVEGHPDFHVRRGFGADIAALDIQPDGYRLK